MPLTTLYFNVVQYLKPAYVAHMETDGNCFIAADRSGGSVISVIMGLELKAESMRSVMYAYTSIDMKHVDR